MTEGRSPLPQSTQPSVTPIPSGFDRGTYQGSTPHTLQKRRTAVDVPHWYNVVVLSSPENEKQREKSERVELHEKRGKKGKKKPTYHPFQSQNFLLVE